MNIKVRSKRTEKRFYIDNEFLNGYAKKVGWQGNIVYIALCRHEKNGKAFPGFRHLAEELGVGIASISKGVKALKEHNIIQIEKGKQNKFTYWLTDYSEWKPVDKWSNRSRYEHTVRNTNDTVRPAAHNNTNRTILIKNSSSSKKKPYFRGMEMRESKGKVWCLPIDGSPWLEFVGDKKDIIYK